LKNSRNGAYAPAITRHFPNATQVAKSLFRINSNISNSLILDKKKSFFSVFRGKEKTLRLGDFCVLKESILDDIRYYADNHKRKIGSLP
jgi:hypothetical protein